MGSADVRLVVGPKPVEQDVGRVEEQRGRVEHRGPSIAESFTDEEVL